MQLKKKLSWQVIGVMGLGVFIGSYWLIDGFLSVLSKNQLSFPTIISAIIPGMGLLFIVLMAKRYPVPYGVSLITLGALLLMSKFFKPWSLTALLFLGIPLIILGILFIWTKSFFEQDNQGKTELSISRKSRCK